MVLGTFEQSRYSCREYRLVSSKTGSHPSFLSWQTSRHRIVTVTVTGSVSWIQRAAVTCHQHTSVSTRWQMFSLVPRRQSARTGEQTGASRSTAQVNPMKPALTCSTLLGSPGPIREADLGVGTREHQSKLTETQYESIQCLSVKSFV